MSISSPAEFTESYAAIGESKTKAPAVRLLLLAILAGVFIGLGGAVTNTATYALHNGSVVRILSGLLFPVGLVMVVLTGAELFTGNCLITISVIQKRASWMGMLRNLLIVYAGNFIGAALLAAALAFFGQLDFSGGGLAVSTIRLAAAKCAMPFSNAFVMGILCNILVCAAVMGALCAKDVAGRAIGAYVPVCVFVLCGFEHSVANMYYIPAGLFALRVPQYAALAAEAGVHVAALTWGGFLLHNLLPVTLGNIVGGVAFAAVIGRCNCAKKACAEK